MTDHSHGTPETLSDDELVEHIKDLRARVQAALVSTTPEGDQLEHNDSRDELDHANVVARNRNIDVPPGR
ncbi:hypothetical protein [Williamsia sp. 1135]|uniref:hypothetical protein n=1 Tax=Williamsia sp. 1135 TaxID=1889262 RepID=UPI000A0FAB3B|nr:hypothetical protein [Williamsia sp. 1135]ORM36101.1 hypothetical protein BFL43_08005 [Williamsia sp. 1135]